MCVCVCACMHVYGENIETLIIDSLNRITRVEPSSFLFFVIFFPTVFFVFFDPLQSQHTPILDPNAIETPKHGKEKKPIGFAIPKSK